MPDTSDDPAAPAPPRYAVGTLRYDGRGLAAVFGWLLWGDLCLNLMESVIPRLVPLQLQAVGASGAVVGFLTVGLFSATSWVLTPIYSTWSDRHRSRRGRRIPFLLYPTPLLAVSLIGVGCSDALAAALRGASPRAAASVAAVVAHVAPHGAALSPQARLSVGLLAGTLLVYRLFDLFPQTAYYYLIRDVVPATFMGRFVCLFRMTATLGSAAFNYCLLRYAPAHGRAVYVGCAALYLVAFTLMSLRVREGEYPPPPPRPRGRPAAGLARWFGESFSVGFYWNYFLTFALYRWATVPFNAFLILYAQRRLGLQPAAFGHTMGILLAMQVPVLLAVGPLLDRFHPVRVGLVGYGLLLAGGAAGFWFVRGPTSFFVATAAVQTGVAVFQGTLGALAPRLLPQARHGQFCAANSMVGEAGLLLLSPLCGWLLDAAGQQYLYAWVAVFSVAGLVANGLLVVRWERLGGDAHYTPPEVPSLASAVGHG